jgi:hypothetical protein
MNPTENTSINDVVWFYTQQGISIDEVVDAHVWVERQLRHYMQDDDVARRAEANLIMQRTRQNVSTEAQDELHAIVPAWWEATTPPQPMARPVVIPPSMMTTNASRPRWGLVFNTHRDIWPYSGHGLPGYHRILVSPCPQNNGL